MLSGIALLSGLASAQSPTSMFAPAATPSHYIFSLSMLVLSVTFGIFLVVAGMLTYALIRFRHRSGDSDEEPPQVYGSEQIELSWTVIPILIVVMLFLTTTRVILGTQAIPKPKNALNVTVVGHQFWWEFRYPKYGIVTANELHVPVSGPAQPQPTYLTMTSADVVHSFWVPRLAGKTDVIPNRVNTMWFNPQKPGLYLGQCAQFCGAEHATMLIRVYAQTPAQFMAWVKHEQQPARQNFPGDPLAVEGEQVFIQNACIACHTIAGTVAMGTDGPNLTHLASRQTIASGSLPNTPANLRKWIADPDAMRPGTLMPDMHLSQHDLDAVTAYLTQLR